MNHREERRHPEKKESADGMEKSIRANGGRERRTVYVKFGTTGRDREGRKHGPVVRHRVGEEAGFERMQRKERGKYKNIVDKISALGEEVKRLCHRGRP